MNDVHGEFRSYALEVVHKVPDEVAFSLPIKFVEDKLNRWLDSELFVRSLPRKKAPTRLDIPVAKFKASDLVEIDNETRDIRRKKSCNYEQAVIQIYKNER